ncbi:MAG: hypothetical protein IT577_21440 [Verrucomicrobiae bacterium]|nr:hypothetical protein [Verrucomicrobiae bacterium]
MKDCNQDIEKYHADRVKLTSAKRAELTARRDANRDRVTTGLKASDGPSPDGFVTQGSHAMRTTILEPNNDYDIDDGVVFVQEDLVGKKGGQMEPLDARKMVRDAVDDGAFKKKPEIKTNCVRVFYNDGPHVDIPVYRRKQDGSTELGSAEWKASDPEGVNRWFGEALASKSGQDAPEQMRAVIRLLKSICANRPSYSLPSGFVLTVLVNECYHTHEDRLDAVVRNAIAAIHSRLAGSLIVRHPVVDEFLTEGADDPKVREFRALLRTALDDLTVLDRANCRRSEALKAWKKVFNTDYFDGAIATAEEEERSLAAGMAPAFVHAPKPWCA